MNALKRITGEVKKLITDTAYKMAAFILMPEKKPINVNKNERIKFI